MGHIRKPTIGYLAACAAIASVLAAPSGVRADDAFQSWTAVPDDVLSVERGRNLDVDVDREGGALAVNIGFQYVINGDLPEGTSSGSIDAPANAFANQRMVINAFNTGHNVTMLNQLSIAVDFSPPPQ